MLQVLSDPILLDFIKVVLQMPEDQRQHFTAMTGHDYDVDGIAIGNYMANGPKWAIRLDNEPIAVGGFAVQRPGVYRDFFLSTAEAFRPDLYFRVTRICRRVMDAMMLNGAHRIECIVPEARVSPQLHKWYAALGYRKEGLLGAYCADGQDALCYVRVGH